jgi:signal transduction histidine kinase
LLLSTIRLPIADYRCCLALKVLDQSAIGNWQSAMKMVLLIFPSRGTMSPIERGVQKFRLFSPSPRFARGDSMSEIEPAPAHAATDNKSASVDYRARLEEVADLVARVRHEINNPLTGVLGQAQLLLREDLSERARRRAQSIEDLAIRLRDIVAQLRDVQRPSAED